MARSGRRRSRRFDVRDVEGSFVIRIDVRVVNLSVAGMSIETRNTLIVGRGYSFRIRQGERQVDVEGRVMWCALTRSERRGEDLEPVFRAGIQFEDVHDATGAELQRLIESSALLDPGAQVLGRFVAAFGAAVDVDRQSPFEVKQLSLSGMLVDADWAPLHDEVIPFEVNLGPASLAGHGRVAYVQGYQADGGVRRFRLGIEFSLISDRARERLAAYISALVTADADAGSA